MSKENNFAINDTFSALFHSYLELGLQLEARQLAAGLLYHGAMSVVHVEVRKRNTFGSACSTWFGSACSTCRGYREPLGIFGSCVKFSVKNTGNILRCAPNFITVPLLQSRRVRLLPKLILSSSVANFLNTSVENLVNFACNVCIIN